MSELTKEQQAVIDAAKELVECQIPDAQKYGIQLHNVVEAYKRSIEPKTDLSKVPLGTRVKVKSNVRYGNEHIGGYLGWYCGYHYIDKSVILHIYSERDGEIFKELEEDCTIIPPTYTTPIWHKWTGERPDWVQDDDKVILRQNNIANGLWTYSAASLSWTTQGTEWIKYFMVIKEQN